MSLITSLVFVASAWCLFNGSAALQGGTPVDGNVPQPLITTLTARDYRDVVIKRCEATIIKRTDGRAHFLTAAECVAEEEAVSYKLLYYKGVKAESALAVPVNGTIHKYAEYVRVNKTRNLAVFSTEDKFKDFPAYNIVDYTSKFIGEKVAYYQWMRGPQGQPKHTKINYARLLSVPASVIDSDYCKHMYGDSPIMDHTTCVSRSKYGQGLSEEQEGTPLLRRDQNDLKQFWLLGIATIVRPHAAKSFSDVIEFLDVRPYRSWIESLDLK